LLFCGMRNRLAAAMKLRRLTERAEGPVRTCLACRGRFLQKELLRFGVAGTGQVEIDPGKKLPGRGVYCCRRAACLKLFVKRKGKILKALRIGKADCGLVERLIDECRLDDVDCF